MGEELERQIRSHFEAGALDEAATVALEGYGREVLGYLIAIMRSEEDASEVFSQVGEDLWRGIPSFRWRCSFRTWLYTLARHAASRFRRAPHNQRGRRVPLSQIGEVAVRVRSRTLPYLRTEVKDRFAELRRSLDADDQSLLIFRVNRGLSWNEIAIVLGGAPADDEAGLERAAARWRQRFQTVKRRLYERARQEGLFDDDSDQGMTGFRSES